MVNNYLQKIQNLDITGNMLGLKIRIKKAMEFSCLNFNSMYKNECKRIDSALLVV